MEYVVEQRRIYEDEFLSILKSKGFKEDRLIAIDATSAKENLFFASNY